MIVHADILIWAAEYDGPLFHAALMDAPYEMEFMGKGWDNSGIAFNPRTWELIARCLHPGAFLFVMAGTLNDDLISVAMRQAGLRKFHKAMAWGYGSGFPKATRVSPQIDRRAGAVRPVIGTKKHQPKFDAAGHGYRKKDNGFNSKKRQTFDVTGPATDLAAAWEGHRYGGQAIKPAVETILIFQKPYEGKPVENIVNTGAGALNIDAGRIGNERIEQGRANRNTDGGYGKNYGATEEMTASGRWPANLVLSHSPGCKRIGAKRVRGNGGTRTPDGDSQYAIYGQGLTGGSQDTRSETVDEWECTEDCAVYRLGLQSGESISRPDFRNNASNTGASGIYGGGYTRQPNSVDDTGTAARYFFQADYMAERLELADAVQYVAKASRSEREAGMDPRTVALMRLLDDSDVAEFDEAETSSIYGNESAEGAARRGRRPRHGFDPTTVDDGRLTPIDNPYQRGKTTRRNTHPTIKPIALARHLATLLLPPALYAPRRLLVPFAGAGSECIGAMLAGWEEVVGVELEVDHVKIAEARLSYWQQRRWELGDPARPVVTRAAPDVPDGQLDMFESEAA